MYNDFVVVGPKADPAKATGKDILEGLKIAAPPRRPSFRAATRAAPTPPNCATGRQAGIDLEAKGAWYRDTGSGMGPALNMPPR
jgi:tungstate transport system substrate-binding protein